MDEKPPVPLHYQPQPRPRPSIVSRFLARLSRPMPMGVYFVIMLALSLIASVIAAIIVAIMNALR